MLNKYFVMAMGVCVSASASVSLANTYTVPSGKYPTIQSAIEACNQNGDDIVVGIGPHFESIDYKGKSIHIHSKFGSGVTFIDGQGISSPLVNFITAEDDQAVLEGFTIRNATTSGAILCNGSSPTINDCKIVGNNQAEGGGIRSLDSNITLNNCEIKYNTAERGGGIYFSGGSLTMSDCLITENDVHEGSGSYGAGIYATDGASVGIDYCTLSYNFSFANNANARGGAIYLIKGSSLSMANSIISNNDVYLERVTGDTNGEHGGQGGAIYIDSSAAVITNCDFYDNNARAHLNDISHDWEGDQGGEAFARGGDICSVWGNLQLTGCTFTNSNANAYGSGAYQGNPPFTDYVYALAQGGSIYIHRGSSALTNCDFSMCTSVFQDGGYVVNGSTGDGGAIWSDLNTNPVIVDCSIVDSHASQNGGGFYTTGEGSAATWLNGYLASNSAGNAGGGIYTNWTSLLVDGALINNNDAPNGGGLFSTAALPDGPFIRNTLFCGNTAANIDGAWFDKGGNTFGDTCGEDCNGNGLPDEFDILWGLSLDCNVNSVPDECDLASGTSQDCNGNDIPDECDIADGTSTDCDGNDVPDECDIDCNENDIPDACDIANGTSTDCDGNTIPDECDLLNDPSLDCNDNGIHDACDIADEVSGDCNANGIPDECDIAGGSSTDCNANEIPDECDPDCNTNGIPDDCDIADGTSADCDNNGTPDECEQMPDCNGNDIHDGCDISGGDSDDNNDNGIPDECECPADVNGDGFVNVNDLLEIVGSWGSPAGDVNGDGTTDVSDLLTVIDGWGECP